MSAPAESGRQANVGEFVDPDDLGRYDCRDVFENMEFRDGDGASADYRCGSWDCYCCGYRMRQNLIEEIERIAGERPSMRRLLTLTLDPATAPADPDERHEYLTDRWNALRTALTDRYGDLSYIWVREEGESGNPHLHIIVDRYIPQGWLSARAEQVGLGEVVDIRRIDRVEEAAHYVGKYLTKEALSDLPTGIRRYGSSADLDLDVRGGDDGDDGSEWELVIEDRTISPVGGDGPLVRAVAPSDFVLQRQWGGPEPPGG